MPKVCDICGNKIGYFDEKYIFNDGAMCWSCARRFFPYAQMFALQMWTQSNSIKIVKDAEKNGQIIKLEHGTATLMDKDSKEAAPINNQNKPVGQSFLDKWHKKRENKAKQKELKKQQVQEAKQQAEEEHDKQVQNWRTEDLSKRATIPNDAAEFGLVLKPKEYVYLAVPQLISWKEDRSKTQRVNYGGLTATVHIAKGLNYRLGSIKPEVQKVKYIVTLFSGALFLTNKRILLINRDGIKAYNLSRLLRAVPYTDGVALYSNSGKRVILDGFSDAEQFNIYLDRLVTEDNILPAPEKRPKKTTHSTKSAKKKDNYDELRELKSLLDDGVITQEDFDAKKKQLLGL